MSITKTRSPSTIAALLLCACVTAASAAPVVVTPGRAAGYMYFPKATSGGGAGGAGSTNYFLKIVYSGNGSSIRVAAPVSPKTAPRQLSAGNYSNPSGSATYYTVLNAANAPMPVAAEAANAQLALTNNPSTITTLSSDLKLTVSIQETLPPTSAPVHIPNTKQPPNTNVGRVVYIAGIPKSINLKPIDGATTITLTLGGPDAVLSTLTMANGTKVLPSILLPDLTLVADGSPTTLPANYPAGYSPIAGTTYAQSAQTTATQSPYEASIGNFYTNVSQFFVPSPAYGNYTIPSLGFIGLSSQGKTSLPLGINPCNNTTMSAIEEGLTIQTDTTGGVSYSLVKGFETVLTTCSSGAQLHVPSIPRVISQGKVAYILTY